MLMSFAWSTCAGASNVILYIYIHIYHIFVKTKYYDTTYCLVYVIRKQCASD